ncbi:MAG: hypothetical protein IME94_07955 [Proteobacteria bacterium]|nr:hypothetical protein [Pseudomonadota bacterium]
MRPTLPEDEQTVIDALITLCKMGKNGSLSDAIAFLHDKYPKHQQSNENSHHWGNQSAGRPPIPLEEMKAVVKSVRDHRDAGRSRNLPDSCNELGVEFETFKNYCRVIAKQEQGKY